MEIINPKDNTITIKKLKNSWNESEILELLKVFNTTGGIPEDEIKDWMYMNLK